MLLLEEIIERNISKLFLNYNVLCAHPFRITRNADLAIDEDEAEDLLWKLKNRSKRGTWGQAIRLEIEAAADRRLLKILCRELSVRKEDVFEIDGPLDLTFDEGIRIGGLLTSRVRRNIRLRPCRSSTVPTIFSM